MPLPSSAVIENALHKFCRIYLEHQNKQDEKSLSDLSLDPIPILLHCSLTGLQSKADMLQIENWRRLDKAFSNAIGSFHETILSSIEGWYKPETGFDLRNDNRNIVVEIKNKHNTMNSSSAQATHDKCLNFVKTSPDYTVYMANIVPKKGREKKPWTIAGRTKNEKILKIDGATLYELVCEEDNALEIIYADLPDIMARHGYPLSSEGQVWFRELYSKLYSISLSA